MLLNKHVFVALLIFTGSAYANLQEKLATNNEKINAAKQDVRAGKSIAANDGCRTKGCSRCNKCNM